MKQLVSTAAVFVAISLAAPSAYALTAAQAKAVKKAITSVPVPEMPAKAAELVTKASKEDRKAVALTAVRAAIYKSRSSAPQVVAAVAKAAPDLAADVSMAAAEMEGAQASLIARAATIAAPQAKIEINASVQRGAALGFGAAGPVSHASGLNNTPTIGGSPRSTLAPRPSAEAPASGTIIQSNIPINGTTFTGYSSTPAPAPTVKNYTLPRGT